MKRAWIVVGLVAILSGTALPAQSSLSIDLAELALGAVTTVIPKASGDASSFLPLYFTFRHELTSHWVLAVWQTASLSTNRFVASPSLDDVVFTAYTAAGAEWYPFAASNVGPFVGLKAVESLEYSYSQLNGGFSAIGAGLVASVGWSQALWDHLMGTAALTSIVTMQLSSSGYAPRLQNGPELTLGWRF